MKANDKRIETTLANDDGRLKFLESCGDGRRSSNESSCSAARSLARATPQLPTNPARRRGKRISYEHARISYAQSRFISSLSYSLLLAFLLIRFVLIVFHRCTDLPLFTVVKCICNNENEKQRISLLSNFCIIHR